MKLIKIFFFLFLLASSSTILMILDYWNLLPQKSFDASYFNITEYHSLSDADSDGIDDNHDIMLNAREVVNSGLNYKSAYYSGGYPTDDYSVCTDVIWYSFQKSGFDLKSMIDSDISENIDSYPINSPDPNIDFRRVKNLKVFFDRYALSLTTDITQIEQWQPGDIVTFSPSHIGIVSDKRNSDGIPYLIHHSGQPVKEEDVFIKHNMKITGHYRFK